MGSSHKGYVFLVALSSFGSIFKPYLLIIRTQGASQTRYIQRVQIEPDRKGWTGLVDMYREYDEMRIKDVKEDIDTLLVFVRNRSLGSFFPLIR